MTLTVNGESTEVPDDLTVAQLVEHLELPVDGVAVAVQLEVVPRGLMGERKLLDGERVEIIRAVGGG